METYPLLYRGTSVRVAVVTKLGAATHQETGHTAQSRNPVEAGIGKARIPLDRRQIKRIGGHARRHPDREDMCQEVNYRPAVSY